MTEPGWRTALIAGLSPAVVWKMNADGAVRTIEEAIEIANRNGVVVPEDVAFFLDEFNELDEQTTARGPRVTKPVGGLVGWSDFVHDRTRKIPITVRSDIMGSDEAIVAVFAHELHEVGTLRRLLNEEGTITIEDFIGLCGPDNPGNLHDKAWSVADTAVRRMRGETE